MDEFMSRIEQAYEKESRERGDDSDPLNAQMKTMQKQLKRAEGGRRWA
jgi:hypothetical protein